MLGTTKEDKPRGPRITSVSRELGGGTGEYLVFGGTQLEAAGDDSWWFALLGFGQAHPMNTFQRMSLC